MHESRRQPVQPIRRPWLWLAVAALAIAAIGVSTLHFVTAACAAARLPAWRSAAGPAGPVQPGVVTRGRAFFYNPGSGNGSCSFGRLSPGGLYVSLGAAQYDSGAACGSYLDVTGPAGTVRAEVVDDCPGCSDGGIDMSAAAFRRVADPSAGTALVSYRLARDPRLPGPLELRVAQAVTSSWLALQVLNHGNPLASVIVKNAGRSHWQPLALSPDDYWVAPSGAGAGPFKVQITDIFGHRAVLHGIRLAPGTVQRTSALLYSAGGTRAGPAAAGPSASAGARAAAGPRSPASAPASARPLGSGRPAASAGRSGVRGHAPGRARAAAPAC